MERNEELAELLRAFEGYLRREERSGGTMEKYLRDTAAFIQCGNPGAGARGTYLGGRLHSRQRTHLHGGWK